MQGVPGLGVDQALHTELRRGRAFAALRAERSRWPTERSNVELLAGGSLEWQRYRDRDDELGLGSQDVRERGHLVLLGVRPTARPTGWLTVRGVLDWTTEGHHPDRADEGGEGFAARRNTVAIGAETELEAWSERLRFVLSTRSDIAVSRTGERSELLVPLTRTDVAWSPQAGVSVEPWVDRDWSVQAFANAGRARRLPGFFELYGDRGTTVGNPELRPETRVGYDVGLRLSGATEHVDGALTHAFFERWVDDLILFVQTGLGAAIPLNIAEAAFRGHELALAGGWEEHLRIGANYSLIDAVDRSPGFDGNRLPGRAVHSWSATLDGSWWWLGLRYRVDGTGDFFLDRSEQRPMPHRIEHDATLFVRPKVVWEPVLAFTVRNLADARTEQVELPDGGRDVEVDRAIADFVGQPLPGRSYHLTLTLRPER